MDVKLLCHFLHRNFGMHILKDVVLCLSDKGVKASAGLLPVHCLRKGQLRLIGRLLYRNGIFQILFDFEDKAIRHGKGKLLAEAAGNGAPGGQRNDTHRQILALPKGIAGQCAVLPS